METAKQTLKLPVPFTIERELEMHRDIVDKLDQVAAIEEQKKKLAGLRTRIEELRLNLKAKVAEEDIEVEDFEDLDTGLIKRRRVDTGEILTSRPMDDEERQLKLNGVSGALQERLNQLGSKTEEQVVATTPEEAEEIRNQRLASEQREREASGEGPKMPRVGDEVEVLDSRVDGGWRAVTVLEANETVFSALVPHASDDLTDYAFDQHGVFWRWPVTWSDAIAASEQAEVARLAADQAADAAKDPKPRALLKAPKRNGKPKRISVVDQDDKPIPPAELAPAPLPEADELCAPDCEKPHVCTIERTAF